MCSEQKHILTRSGVFRNTWGPVGLEAGALQPRIDPAGAVRPQLGVCLHQRVDFEGGEFPSLSDQGGKRLLRKTSEFEPEFLVGDETSYDSFNSSL